MSWPTCKLTDSPPPPNTSNESKGSISNPVDTESKMIKKA